MADDERGVALRAYGSHMRKPGSQRSATPASRSRRPTSSRSWRGASPGNRGRRRPRRQRYPLAIQLRTAISRRRRLVAAALLSVAVAIAVMQISPDDRDTVPVVVAARPLGAGTVLSSADLKVVEYPAPLAPASQSGAAADTTGTPTAVTNSSADDGDTVELAGALPHTGSLNDWVGRTLSTAVVEGQPLTGPSVVGPDLLAGQPAGTTAVTVRVSDPGALTHLRPGQRVDLVNRAADGSIAGQDPDNDDHGSAAAQVVARDVTVLWVADPTEPESGLLSAAGTADAEDLMVVGADTETAQAIAARESQQLVPVLVSSLPEISPSAEAADP